MTRRLSLNSLPNQRFGLHLAQPLPLPRWFALRCFALSRISALALAIALGGGLVACGGNQTTSGPSTSAITSPKAAVPVVAGDYPVQQATYNNSTGEYTLMLLNAPPGMNPYRVSNLQMAQIPEAAVKAGKTTYLAISRTSSQPVLYLLPDFKIEMLSGEVAQTQTQQAGMQPTYWQPMYRGPGIDLNFYQPYYYVPPPYQSGSILTGFGGYGSTYDRAASQYQQRYNAPPAPVQNRNFRSTQNLRPSPAPSGAPMAPASSPAASPRSSGFGSSPQSPAATTTEASPGRSSTSTSTPPSTSSPASSPASSPSTNQNRSSGAGFGSSTFRSSDSPSRERSSGSSSRRSGFGSSGSGRRRR